MFKYISLLKNCENEFAILLGKINLFERANIIRTNHEFYNYEKSVMRTLLYIDCLNQLYRALIAFLISQGYIKLINKFVK